jgi:uncharacterized membrane protein
MQELLGITLSLALNHLEESGIIKREKIGV